MQARNAASVLPEPVGAEISVVRPARMCGQPCSCGSVGVPKRATNQSRTSGCAQARPSGAGGIICWGSISIAQFWSGKGCFWMLLLWGGMLGRAMLDGAGSGKTRQSADWRSQGGAFHWLAPHLGADSRRSFLLSTGKSACWWLRFVIFVLRSICRCGRPACPGARCRR